MKPQAEVLYHVIAQPNSRDAVHSMLGMNRQVRPCLDPGVALGNGPTVLHLANATL